jgi:hypothetical protein
MYGFGSGRRWDTVTPSHIPFRRHLSDHFEVICRAGVCIVCVAACIVPLFFQSPDPSVISEALHISNHPIFLFRWLACFHDNERTLQSPSFRLLLSLSQHYYVLFPFFQSKEVPSLFAAEKYIPNFTLSEQNHDSLNPQPQ